MDASEWNEVETDPGALLTRRRFLTSVGIAAGGLVLPTAPGLTDAHAEIATAGFGAGRALRAAMHVHGSWSEQAGSWEAQLVQAASNGYDVLYLTDHDCRATAWKYLTSLSGAVWDPVVSEGRLAQRTARHHQGSLHLRAESAEAHHPASVAMSLHPLRFRTSVSGLTIEQHVGSVRLSEGAHYELILDLSYHPARAGRPAGQYRLVYRFGTARRRWKKDHGLTGVVGLPRPHAGSSQTLVPTRDIAALWPDLVAIDNGSYGLSFRAWSPHRGAVCDVRLRSVRFHRSRSSVAHVLADQHAVVAAYRSRFPSVDVHRSIEVSRTEPHMIPFGIPPWLPDYRTLSSDSARCHRQIAHRVHAMGGLLSYNHPLGVGVGTVFSRAGQNVRRRHVFRNMQAAGLFGADILEVGYNVRGHADCATHLALWDTFSRNGDFLTGNGVSDDHSGVGWRTRPNGFATGIWAASTRQEDLVTALAAGRVFAAHAGRWPGGIDLLVDGSVPMGAVSVSNQDTRSLAIWATDLPRDGAVQVVHGPVDYGGNVNPGTRVSATLTPSSFHADVATVAVDTSTSTFVRAQVLDGSGQILGTSNPVWLLRAAPPGGIPAARRVG